MAGDAGWRLREVGEDQGAVCCPFSGSSLGVGGRRWSQSISLNLGKPTGSGQQDKNCPRNP
jgi:hypothetical protein